MATSVKMLSGYCNLNYSPSEIRCKLWVEGSGEKMLIAHCNCNRLSSLLSFLLLRTKIIFC